VILLMDFFKSVAFFFMPYVSGFLAMTVLMGFFEFSKIFIFY
jgi:hypothetical protein